MEQVTFSTIDATRFSPVSNFLSVYPKTTYYHLFLIVYYNFVRLHNYRQILLQITVLFIARLSFRRTITIPNTTTSCPRLNISIHQSPTIMDYLSDCSTTWPISPCRKRLRGEDIDDSPKRTQTTQIHSEAHISTVSMMMEALRRQKAFPNIEEGHEEAEEVTDPSTFQKPFWPQLVRARTE